MVLVQVQLSFSNQQLWMNVDLLNDNLLYWNAAIICWWNYYLLFFWDTFPLLLPSLPFSCSKPYILLLKPFSTLHVLGKAAFFLCKLGLTIFAKNISSFPAAKTSLFHVLFRHVWRSQVFPRFSPGFPQVFPRFSPGFPQVSCRPLVHHHHRPHCHHWAWAFSHLHHRPSGHQRLAGSPWRKKLRILKKLIWDVMGCYGMLCGLDMI